MKIILSVAAAFAVIRFALFVFPMKSLEDFQNKQNSTRFYDRNGQLMYVMPLKEGLRREYFSLDEFPPEVLSTFIEAEDRNFYIHPGVDVISIFRAISQNGKADRIVSGASTITMQLARMIYPRKSKVTTGMKIKEACIAVLIECKLSKKKILELYLNNVPFGFQIEGVGSAARSFFGVEPSALSSEQIKLLSQIPRRPSDNAPEKKYEYPQINLHFINTVIKKYADENKTVPDSLKLSVDCSLGAEIELEIQRKLEEYKDARIHNGSALVINNRTGEIMAWVGNSSFSQEHGGQIDGVLVKNQPGSSMKPFIYAMAIERGHSPCEIIPDIPMDFGSSKVYVPLNFNNRYNGPVSMRVALASSLNIPAVYMLYNLHVDDYMSLLSDLGYRSLDGQRSSTGLSIALGSSEVTLYEMVRAFSVFTRDGSLPELDYVYSRNHKKTRGTEIFSKDTARIICDFLSDKAARNLGFGHAQVFDTPYPAIFKTGTSNQYQNIIALGSTSEFTAGVWLGNFEGETVIKQTGSSIPAAVVRKILDELTEKYGAKAFPQPEGFEKKMVCALSGMEPDSACPSVTMEYAEKKQDSVQKCTWHSENNGIVKVHYPTEYQHWALGRNISGDIQKSQSQLELLYPTRGAVFLYDSSIPESVQQINIQAFGGQDSSARLYVDGKDMGSVSGRFSWHVPLVKGKHEVQVQCGDQTVSSYYSVD